MGSGFRIVTYDLNEFVQLARLEEPFVRYEFRRSTVNEYAERLILRIYAPSRDGMNVVVFEESTVIPRYVGAEDAKMWIEKRMELIEKLKARPGRLEV